MGNRVPITDRIVKKVPMMSWHLSRTECNEKAM